MTKSQACFTAPDVGKITNSTLRDLDCQEEDVVTESSPSENCKVATTSESFQGITHAPPVGLTKETENLSEAQEKPHPFVFWSQTDTSISIRVDLLQAKNVRVTIEGDKEKKLEDSDINQGTRLIFNALGRGAHGIREYQFELDFFAEVSCKYICHIIERYVLLLITKSDSTLPWGRLTKHKVRFPWLRVDFDRYADSEDSSEDKEVECLARDRQAYEQLRESLEKNSDRKQQLAEGHKIGNSWSNKLDNILGRTKTIDPDIFNPFDRGSTKSKGNSNMKYDYRKETDKSDTGRNTAKSAMDFKKTYLFVYNLILFVMFLKVYMVLLIKGFSGTVDDGVVEGTAFIVKMLTFTQLLETLHPILGLVPGGPAMPFLQSVGRIVVNYFLVEPSVRVGAAPYTQYLFMVWSSIEIFRYSYYALRVFKVNIYFLTWCRYTLFLPLYPAGGFCESMVIYSAIRHFKSTGTFTVRLPNPYNISFDPSIALQIYIYLLLGPSIYYLMRYMWVQRCKQLSKEKVA